MTEHAIVTGGAGFVGSHLVDRLLADGFEVTSLDNYGSGREENLAHLTQHPDFEARDHDVRTPFPEFDSVDHVYHFASRASPTDFHDHALEIALSNSLGTQHAYELARAHDATVVLASTSEVYGDPEIHPQPESYHGDVNVRGYRAPYDESKRFAEALGVAHEREHGLDVRTVRIFNTYGPRMRANDGRVIPTFITQALRDDDLTIHGTGAQTRSFCYVDDLVDGVRRLAEAPAAASANEVFNVGNTTEITIQTLAETVVELTQSRSEFSYRPRPEDDPEVRRPDISRARSVLDWTPTTDLETGLRQTIAYFEEQLTGVQNQT